MMKTRNIGLSLLAASALGVSMSASAGKMWSDDYETYIDSGFKDHVICAQPGRGSDRLVWNDDYESYMPANFAQHVIARHTDGGATGAVVYSADYESYVSDKLGRLRVANDVACPLG